MSSHPPLLIYTDGSSLGNPGKGGYGAVLFSDYLGEVIELGGRKERTTNNEMELSAVIAALSYGMHTTLGIRLFSDSQYVINGATKWMTQWERNGWMTKGKEEVKNKALWQLLREHICEQESLEWNYVEAHAGTPGNERADAIARGFAKGDEVSLYRGPKETYPLKEVLTAPHPSSLQKKKTGKAYSYLSLIDKDFMRHDSWEECYARVKGKNARFKKALSEEHEREIKKEWGIS